MRLKSVSFYHHKVYGSTKINFFENSSPIKENLTKQYHADILLDYDTISEGNYYTYIIGQNGVGKTILFRAIINAINYNAPYFDDEKFNAIAKLFNRNGKYFRFREIALSRKVKELRDLGIYNLPFSIGNLKDDDLLEVNDAVLMFISSSVERTLVDMNRRYRNFNYVSELNYTKALLLKALIKFKNSDKITILSSLLDRDKIHWQLSASIAAEARVLEKEEMRFVLRNENDINIFNFLETIKKIKITDEGILDYEVLNNDELKVFEAIYNSDMFLKLYYDTNISLKKLFEELKASSVIKRIESFIASIPELKLNLEYLNVLIPNERRKEWEFLFSKTDELSEYDAGILLLLESLNLIDITLFCNEVDVANMSSGEQSIIRLFSFFADLPIENHYKNLIVFFDEPENTLHPVWQQNFPKIFKTIVEDIYEIKNSHFVFSTHSPLIIMKSPTIKNSNVIQFAKDEKDNFYSRQIQNINSFSIEEVLLDEFKISYRDKELENQVKKILDEKSKIQENIDPINAVIKSDDLRNKINDLLNKLNIQE